MARAFQSGEGGLLSTGSWTVPIPKVVHFNRLKPAPLDTTPEEVDEYVNVHSLLAKPPLDNSHLDLATILEEPI